MISGKEAPPVEGVKSPLPTQWNSKDKCSHLVVKGNGMVVEYTGTGKSDHDAGTVRANYPITPSCGIFYYEIRVLDKGRDGYIGVGVCTANMQLSRLPGWERNTYGYHGDDGNLFRGSGQGRAYGPTFTTKDVVGCCVNFISSTIFFTKNGIPLGLRTPGERIEVNFGQKSFEYDYEQYLREEKHRVFSTLEKVPYPEGDFAASSLVLSYLIHHGYSETVRLFARDSGVSGPQLDAQLVDIENRQRLCALLRTGDIDKVINELNRIYPDFLHKRKDILFKLLSQKFIEMIKVAPIEDTMVFGQTELYKFEKESPQYKKDLEEVFSLLAYIEPQKSPMAYLLDESRRDPIISDLNCALLVHTNRPPMPQLEKVVRQTSIVLDEVLNHSAGPAAIFMKVNDFIYDERNYSSAPASSSTKQP
jgi:hypothetical protein